jgi:tRNA A37 N6-isopentenylltransferase MiaA
VPLTTGYREFLPVVTADRGVDLTALRVEAARQMKTHTRQYVSRQIQWLNHKLLPQCKLLGSKTPVYILDATDPQQWSTKVFTPALNIARGNFDLPLI